MALARALFSFCSLGKRPKCDDRATRAAMAQTRALQANLNYAGVFDHLRARARKQLAVASLASIIKHARFAD